MPRHVLRRFGVVVCGVAAVVALVAPSAMAERGTRTPATRAATTREPVLLVHGFGGSSAGWSALIAVLRAQGYRAADIDAIDYPRDASNVDVAAQIAREVDALKARTGARRVDLVSHSMGAISTRYYLEHLGGDADVDAWVSLAGVNAGTVWAYGCYVLAPCREMVPSSSLLEELNSGFHPDPAIRYGAWWSPCDDVVVPRGNAELAGAHNVETSCLGHSEVRTDPQVLTQVARFLGSGR